MNLLKTLLFLFPFLSLGQMSGNYTVGGTSPDFQTIGEACDSIVSQGLSGAVTVNIRDGVYANDSIYLHSIVGSSANNSITFQSESLDSAAVEINQDASFVVHLLDSTCQYITLQHLSLVQNANVSIVQLEDGASYCNFESNHFKKFGASDLCIKVSTSSMLPVSKNLSIQGNNFTCENGADTEIINIATGLPTKIDSIKIDGNTVLLPQNQGIYNFSYLSGCSNIEITNNKVVGVCYFGMEIFESEGTVKVSGNELYLYEDGAWAVNVEDGNVDVLVTNNLLKVGTGISNSNSIGVDLAGISGTAEVYNNTILSDAIGMYFNDVDSVIIRNNLVFVNFQGTTTQFRGVYQIGGSTSISADFNASYSNTDYARFPSGTDYPDFTSYQQATGNDANGFVLIDPLFYDDSLDLHVCSDSLIGTGDPAISLAIDVDNDVRNAPSIGADYFEPVFADFSYTVNGYDVQFTNTSTWADGYLWDFGDGSTSTDINPTHTFATSDGYSVTLTANNFCGADDTTIMVNITVGLKELTDSRVVIYPNPNNGVFSIEVDQELTSIRILDQFGRLVSEKVAFSNGKYEVESLIPGMYFVELQLKEESLIKKVVVR